ncbi:unnamed protein product, partial [Prorocentrum cordatum]
EALAAVEESSQAAESAADLPRGGTAAADLHLVLAEALWQQAHRATGEGTELALPHYEAAAALVQGAGDARKEGMVALGHGFALAQLGRPEGARERLLRARLLAEADGNAGALQFVDRLLAQVGGGGAAAEGPRPVLDAWRQFAEAFSAGKPAVLFCRGGIAAPGDAATRRAATKLRACGCLGVEALDVLAPGPGVPEGLQGVLGSPHLELPQLFVGGQVQAGWEDLSQEALRGLLGAAGLSLSEPPGAEPCHGTGAFAEGLEAWEVALVEIISKDGAGDWPRIAEQLVGRGFGDVLPRPPGSEAAAAALEAAWQGLAPTVKERLGAQPEMPCGHSCSTCPTRHECQLHDAVDGRAKDIEDLA